MCGLVGIYNIRVNKKIEKELLDAMTSKIQHRGPDASGLFMLNNAALAFVSFGLEKGCYEIYQSEDKKITALCNGIINNYKELRDILESKGHVIKSNLSAGLIPHLYEEFGKGFVSRINGQFGIALLDEKANRCILYRDKMGICPMFYSVIDGQLVFASEIKAILEHPAAERKINLSALDDLMNFPGVVAPHTFFKNVFAVRPGHMIIADFGQDLKDEEYWDICFPEEVIDLGEDYYVEGLRSLLKSTIEKRATDENFDVGFLLSGGLDSSTIASFIGKYKMGSKCAFSAEIGEGDLNEQRFQQMVRELYPFAFETRKIKENDIMEILPDVIYAAESAVKESYDAAANILFSMVKESGCKAALTGQGSDELLCGYVGHLIDLFRNMQKDAMTEEERALNKKLWGDEFFRYERNHPENRKIHAKVYSKDVWARINEFSSLNESPVDVRKLAGLSDQKRRSYIDCKLRLGDHLLIEHGDHQCSAHGIEGRHPFLDGDMVDFILTMPDKYKMKGSNEKYILKKAGEGIVPQPILKRRKFPFQAPGMSSMIKECEKIPYLGKDLIKKYGIFDADYIEELKNLYSAPDFKLMGAYEIDYLLIAMTTTILCEKYNLSL